MNADIRGFLASGLKVPKHRAGVETARRRGDSDKMSSELGPGHGCTGAIGERELPETPPQAWFVIRV
ncbi:MAG: hypothetical protein Q7T82_16255 [Armatimonadota bacterium]|nr:hypothetical protein [Armatimonadota bacterium]